MLCCGCLGLKNMSPMMLVVLATVVALLLGCNMDNDDKELVGNALLAVGQLLILMALQQENIMSKNCYH
ncbi:MAG: hypothetical protein AB9856_05770 [Cellulosilyticaceae bacterium]